MRRTSSIVFLIMGRTCLKPGRIFGPEACSDFFIISFQAEIDCREGLADSVMKFHGQSLPLLFLGADQFGRQVPQFLFRSHKGLFGLFAFTDVYPHPDQYMPASNSRRTPAVYIRGCQPTGFGNQGGFNRRTPPGKGLPNTFLTRACSSFRKKSKAFMFGISSGGYPVIFSRLSFQRIMRPDSSNK